MAAITFHTTCTPTVAGDFATLKSKFDGTCGACRSSFAKGDTILYWNPLRKQQTSRAPVNTAPSNVAPTALETTVTALSEALRAFDQHVSQRLKVLERNVLLLQRRVYPELADVEIADEKQAEPAVVLQGREISNEQESEDAF